MLTTSVSLNPISAHKLFPTATFENCTDISIKSCRYNAQNIQPGEVYVAMEDPSVDPSGVEEARKRGAIAIIARNQFAFDESCDCLTQIPVCRIDNPHVAYAEICQNLYGNPGKNLKITGITGRRGRRVVSNLISTILSLTGHKTGLLTEQGVTIFGTAEISHAPKNKDEFYEAMSQIVKSYPSEMTGLAPKKSAYWLSKMVQNGCDNVVMEVSQTVLDKSNASGIPFYSGCNTFPLIQEHSKATFSRNEPIARLKLIDQLDKKGCIVLNGDVPLSNSILQRIHCPVLTFGLGSNCQVHGTILEQNLGEQIALITAGSQTTPLRTKTIGQDFLYYCLCAIAFGLTCSLQLTELIRILETMSVIPGYMQQINSPLNFPVFLVQDLSNSDDPLEINLKTIQNVISGRLLNVLPIPVWSPVDNNCEFNVNIYRPKRDKVFLVGKESDNPDFVQALKNRLDERVQIFTDKQEAVQFACKKAKRSDTLVIAGTDNFHKALTLDVPSDANLVFSDNQTSD